MTEKNDYLLLIWKDPYKRKNYTIGKLTKSSKYTFEYCEEASEASESGWTRLEAFPDDKKYESDTLFPIFCSRLPDKKRRDINAILEKYELTTFDEFELLKKSGARLPIDTYYFVAPMPANKENVEQDFFIMGIRHNTLCKGNYCDLLPQLKVGENVYLRHEDSNSSDKFAILVETIQREKLGYVPRYYNKVILEYLNKNKDYSCTVTNINKDNDCSECVKVKLKIS